MTRRFFRQRRLPGWLTRTSSVVRWVLRIALILLIVDLFYLSVTWPDWKAIARGPVPKSAFIAEYERQAKEQPGRPPRRWQPVPLASMPKHLTRAVVLAEDSRFYEHSGFDLIAFKEAMGRNLKERRVAFGASTISQQTVKNLFLTRSRNPVRKWHELILTWGMENNLGKARILELYLNVAEFGAGVYGVQAAAQHYWQADANQLSPRQSVELAATLPSPTSHNPATRTATFDKRWKRVLRLLHRFPGEAAASLAGLGEALPPEAADLVDEPLDAEERER